jgi:hypothetical protein
MVARKSIPAGRTAAKPAAKPAPAKPATAVSAKPAPAAKVVVPPAEPAAVAKVKHKLVRDSFTIPKGEYAVLEELKQRANRLAQPAKKGELIRAGIVALKAMSDALFLATLKTVPSLKTGRPKKVKAPATKAAGKKA